MYSPQAELELETYKFECQMKKRQQEGFRSHKYKLLVITKSEHK